MAADQIDLFMRAIMGQESGGNPTARNSSSGAYGLFQIMPSNWPSWSKEAFGRVVEQTAENQHAVARHKMLQYYRAFGSWEAVAVAWFAGPGRAARYVRGDRKVLNLSDGNMTVREYIQKMRRGMGRGASDSTEAMAMRRSGAYGKAAGERLTAAERGEAEPVDPIERKRAAAADDRTLLTTVLDGVSRMVAGGERTPIATKATTMTVAEVFGAQEEETDGE